MPTLTLRGATVETASNTFVHPLPVTARSWADVAELAWLEAQIAAAEVEHYERRIIQFEQRLIAARSWFSNRERSHPHWDGAEYRRAGIEREQRNTEATLPCLMRRCWVGCIDLHTALTQMNKVAAGHWVVENGLLGEVWHPKETWRLLMADRACPGSYPPVDRDYWVEHRPRRVELWHLPEMRELLGKWAA